VDLLFVPPHRTSALAHTDLPEGAFLGPKTNETESDRSDYSQGMRFLAHALFVNRFRYRDAAAYLAIIVAILIVVSRAHFSQSSG
jgi:hypothetical protein